MDDRKLEMCWGCAQWAGLADLADLAANAGFAAITITPRHYQQARAAGANDAAVARILSDAGVRVSLVEPVVSALPGIAPVDEAPAAFRHVLDFTVEDCIRAAHGVGAVSVNIAHFLGRPVPLAQLGDAVGAVVRQLEGAGLGATLEFLPGTGVPDLATALAIVDAVGGGRLGVMFDVWHFARSGGVSADLDEAAIAAIGGIQISDRIVRPAGVPEVRMAARLYPGAGGLPLADWARMILGPRADLRVGVEVFDSAEAPASVASLSALARATRLILPGA